MPSVHMQGPVSSIPVHIYLTQSSRDHRSDVVHSQPELAARCTQPGRPDEVTEVKPVARSTSRAASGRVFLAHSTTSARPANLLDANLG